MLLQRRGEVYRDWMGGRGVNTPGGHLGDGFDSQSVLGPAEVRERQEQSLGFVYRTLHLKKLSK